MFYILDGNDEPVKVDLLEWSDWYAHSDRTVAWEANRFLTVEVSTVFLGIDHGHGLTKHPVLFETMVFGGEFDGLQRRYHTKREALDGHARILTAVLPTINIAHFDHTQYHN